MQQQRCQLIGPCGPLPIERPADRFILHQRGKPPARGRAELATRLVSRVVRALSPGFLPAISSAWLRPGAGQRNSVPAITDFWHALPCPGPPGDLLTREKARRTKRRSLTERRRHRLQGAVADYKEGPSIVSSLAVLFPLLKPSSARHRGDFSDKNIRNRPRLAKMGTFLPALRCWLWAVSVERSKRPRARCLTAFDPQDITFLLRGVGAWALEISCGPLDETDPTIAVSGK